MKRIFNENAEYIDEPKLMFKGDKTSFNPQVGLFKYGPRTKKDFVGEIKIGIIGTNKSISQLISLLRKMQSPIKPRKKTTRYRLPFPGFSRDSTFKIELNFQREYQENLSIKEIEKIKETDFKLRVDVFSKFVFDKMKLISSKHPPPDIFLITIPEVIMDLCKEPGSEKPKLKLSNFDDFHDRIKLYGMHLRIPTQIIRPETLLLKNTQDIALVCWNLGVAMLYKAQKGFPWKLTYLEENTCYVGITFFREIAEEKHLVRTSLAQVFLDTGESFILRGDSFKWQNRKHPCTPHLDINGAKMLIKQVIKQYEAYRRTKPNRIVIHKTSSFWEDEREGFYQGTDTITERDFITINNSDIKLYRNDRWFVPRGLFLTNNRHNIHYLYTIGYNPYLQTYIGFGVPTPLRISVFTEDPNITKIFEEILSFTKLDWNNVFFNCKLPVTLAVSRRLGRILANSYAKGIEIDPHYYYYM